PVEPLACLTILLPDPRYRAARYLLNLACDPDHSLLAPPVPRCPHDTDPACLTTLTSPDDPPIPHGSPLVDSVPALPCQYSLPQPDALRGRDLVPVCTKSIPTIRGPGE
ncbi:unnamed protein product, partial [Staurois parvus]